MVFHETGLNLTKSLTLKLAAQLFTDNKRTTQVNIKGYNKRVICEYKGARNNLKDIMDNVTILRVLDL
jgi:hypothetical protein